MIYYGYGDKKILPHDIARAVEDLILQARSIICSGFDGNWSQIEMLLAGYAENVTPPQKTLIDQIGVDNAVQLAILMIQAENLLIDHLEKQSDTVEQDSEVNEIHDTPPDEDDKQILKTQCVEIAQLCWNKRIGIQHLAAHLQVSNEDIKQIRLSDEYMAAVENLIFAERTAPEIIEWVETYPRETMPSRFSKRMGLTEQGVSKMIDRVMDKARKECN